MNSLKNRCNKYLFILLFYINKFKINKNYIYLKSKNIFLLTKHISTECFFLHFIKEKIHI